MTDTTHGRLACDEDADKTDVSLKRNRVRPARDDMAKAFGKVLRERRTARGLSQEELAARCEVQRTYPSLLERGLRTPTLLTIVQLADGLSIPATDLVALTLQELQVLRATKQEPRRGARRPQCNESRTILSSQKGNL